MTQVTSTYAPASEKQIKFLDDLVKNREVPREMVSAYLAEKETLDIKKASSLIGLFLGYPKVVVQPTLPSPAFAELVKKAEPNLYGELIGALQGVPKSKYAIPVSELMTDLLTDAVHGDLVFLEVKEYMNKTYMKKLYGSVGAFTRVRPAIEDALVFVKIIKADPYKYTKLFAEHYQCCGKCGAELTDPKSRELMLGPECRKAFSL
jgi:hypothetical protein